MQKLGVVITGECPTKVYGLTAMDRAQRFFAKRGVSVMSLQEAQQAADEACGGGILLLRGDHVFDVRILQSLIDAPGTALRNGDDGEALPLAVHAAPARVREAMEWMQQGGEGWDGLRVTTPDHLVEHVHLFLLTAEPPVVLPLSEENRKEVERVLFDASYKGVTDCVTKWVWPAPARAAVRVCAKLGLRPNHVTAVGFTSMLLALWLFWQGHFGLGLIAGWFMTFLDTVDGKLARTTLTSNKVGHLCDKLMDIIHPPFWYLAWAFGLERMGWTSGIEGLSFERQIWLIFVFYIVGRLVEITASEVFIAGGLFLWRPMDSFFRLVTARRNTCLLLMTASVALARPDWGLLGVALWTLATTLFLALRLAVAAVAWLKQPKRSKLQPWLLSIQPKLERSQQPLSVRVFTRL